MQNRYVNLIEKIAEYGKIVISRHIRPDGDAIGSTLALREIIRDSFPEKDVRVINSDSSDTLAFLGSEDGQADRDFYSDALVIVLDTATSDRCANPSFRLGREIIKIDHHPETDPYGDINIVNSSAASASEIIADIAMQCSYSLSMSKRAAYCLYTGIVTDTVCFRASSVSPSTMRCAAFLLESGIETESIFSNIYLEDVAMLRFRAEVMKKTVTTENGFAYVYVDAEMQKKYPLTQEQYSLSVTVLENIRNCPFWAAFIDNGDGSTRVRLRSRFITVNGLAAEYHGGGHSRASGATVYSSDEMKRLISDADALIKKSREENPGLF